MSIGLSSVKRKNFRLCLSKRVNKCLDLDLHFFFYIDSSEDEIMVIKKEKKQDRNPMIQSEYFLYKMSRN